MSIRSLAKKILPQPVRAFLKRAQRRLKWSLARARGAGLGKADLIAGLQEVGVSEGDVLLVHSSLSSLGHVEGGPETVIDALLEAVGPTGTVLMPAYPVVGDWLAYARSDPLFDPHQAPSSMGKITDVFWRCPGTRRSLHPTHSVAAYGPQAEYLVRDHEKSPSPCGATSPFRKVVELDGRILHLGSPFCNTTSLHVVEDIVPNFPRKVYMDEPIPMRYVDEAGREHTVPVLLHDPTTAATRLEKIKAKEEEIYRYCHERGIVRTGKIGRATVHLIEARPLEELLEELVPQGITIYA